MNYLYLSKKVNIGSAYLNLLSSIGWISLVLLIGYYHLWVLHDGKEYYKGLPMRSFLDSPFLSLKQRVPVSSVQATNAYSGAYIQEQGLASFFETKGFWKFIQPIYLISIITSSLNLLLTLVSWFCFCKARDFNYLVSSLANLLLPVLGGIFSLKINNRLSSVWGPKAVKIVSPAQWCKLKTKLFLTKVFCETTIPAY